MRTNRCGGFDVAERADVVPARPLLLLLLLPLLLLLQGAARTVVQEKSKVESHKKCNPHNSPAPGSRQSSAEVKAAAERQAQKRRDEHNPNKLKLARLARRRGEGTEGKARWENKDWISVLRCRWTKGVTKPKECVKLTMMSCGRC